MGENFSGIKYHEDLIRAYKSLGIDLTETSARQIFELMAAVYEKITVPSALLKNGNAFIWISIGASGYVLTSWMNQSGTTLVNLCPNRENGSFAVHVEKSNMVLTPGVVELANNDEAGILLIIFGKLLEQLPEVMQILPCMQQ